MNKWLIFSKDNCPYCDKAKFALKDEAEVEVKNISGSAVFMAELREMNPNARTMPQVFLNGNLIGGYDDLKNYLDVQKLNLKL